VTVKGMDMGITNMVHRLNTGLDGLLLAVSPLALKIGLILGTVSLLLGGSLAQNTVFQWAWSIIQAVGVDSVFLITARLFLTVSWRSWDKATFGLLTLLYGSVALLALNIVSYQELRASSLSAAMSALNIDLGVFTTLRSVVIVGTIALFYLIEDKANQIYGLGHKSQIAGHVDRVVEQEQGQIERPGSNQEQLSHRVNPTQPKLLEGLHQEANPYPEGQPNNPYPQPDATQDNPSSLQGLTQQPNPSNPQPNPTTQEDEGLTQPDNLTYLRVLNAYRVLNQQGEEVTAAKIVDMAGVGLSSAKKYLRQIRG